MKKWKQTGSSIVYENKLFRIKKEKCIIPRTGNYYDYFYEDSSNWVNVVPLTKNNKVILVKQYRHAIREFTLEIPGGIIDWGEKSLAAAKRELLEETGYGGGSFRRIGCCRPNPAIINNRTFTYLARDVQKIAPQRPDSTEEIEVMEVSPERVADLILTGKITHTLVITAFHYAMKYLNLASP